MKVDKLAIISNVFSGCGRDYVLNTTSQIFEILKDQVSEILVGPGDMGETVCKAGNVAVVGSDQTKTRMDTIVTTRDMVAAGAELFVIISGDGTFNDALEGMKSVDSTVPIFGFAAGQFSTLYSYRKHDPFVSMRGEVVPFAIEDLHTADVMGMVCRVNGKITGYGFFWITLSNILAYNDPGKGIITIDAAAYIDGKVQEVSKGTPIECADTCIRLESEHLGSIVLAKGEECTRPVVAHLVPEINQVMAGGFGAMVELMGFHGVAYCVPGAKFDIFPSPAEFPIQTKSLAFYEGDQVIITGVNENSVLQADSTAIMKLCPTDKLSVEVVRNLGKKAFI
jgi:hypothetical protein